MSKLSSTVGDAEPPVLARGVADAVTAWTTSAGAGGAASTAISSNMLFNVYGVQTFIMSYKAELVRSTIVVLSVSRGPSLLAKARGSPAGGEKCSEYAKSWALCLKHEGEGLQKQ